MSAELLILPLDKPRGYRIVGELDSSNADQLAEVLREESRQPGDIILDVSGLTFMDSSGLHVVLDARDQLRGGRLIMRDPTPAIDRVFEVAGIEGVEGILVQRSAN